MAKQEGLIKLTGRINDVSFYKRGGNYFMKGIGGAERETVLTSPRFKRTREGMAEFGHAGSTASRIRKTLFKYLPDVPYNNLHNRLSAELLKVIQTDTDHLRGERNIYSGDISLLKGFDFNRFMKLEYSCFGKITSDLDIQAGRSIITLNCVAINEIKAPKGATHFNSSSQLIALPFDITQPSELHESNQSLTTLDTNSVHLHHEINFTTKPDHFYIQLFYMEFLQELNGRYYEIAEKGGRVLNIISVM